MGEWATVETLEKVEWYLTDEGHLVHKGFRDWLFSTAGASMTVEIGGEPFLVDLKWLRRAEGGDEGA